jgi:hypothetical protein
MMRKRKRKNLFSDDKINEEIEMKTFSGRRLDIRSERAAVREREEWVSR